MSTERLVRLILVLLLVSSLGVIAELVLLAHYEDWQQWLPLAALVAGAAATTATLARPGRSAARWLRAIAVLQVPTGLLGVYFHIADNIEFERERDVTATAFELFGASLSGALPALAPGALVMLGVLGLIAASAVAAISNDATWSDAKVGDAEGDQGTNGART